MLYLPQATTAITDNLNIDARKIAAAHPETRLNELVPIFAASFVAMSIFR